jgi:hypothetical protein
MTSPASICGGSHPDDIIPCHGEFPLLKDIDLSRCGILPLFLERDDRLPLPLWPGNLQMILAGAGKVAGWCLRGQGVGEAVLDGGMGDGEYGIEV